MMDCELLPPTESETTQMCSGWRAEKDHGTSVLELPPHLFKPEHMNYTGSEANSRLVRHQVSLITTLNSHRTCVINMYSGLRQQP